MRVNSDCRREDPRSARCDTRASLRSECCRGRSRLVVETIERCGGALGEGTTRVLRAGGGMSSSNAAVSMAVQLVIKDGDFDTAAVLIE